MNQPLFCKVFIIILVVSQLVCYSVRRLGAKTYQHVVRFRCWLYHFFCSNIQFWRLFLGLTPKKHSVLKIEFVYFLAEL